jgi:ATP-dependent helicase/nuclease subunit A
VAGDGGDADVARFLRRAVEEGRENRLSLPPDLEADAVHVMTIHRAKGLDFEHVYVAQIHKRGGAGGRRETAGLMSVDGRPEYHLFGWTTPGFVSGEWIQARKTRAEMVRLLYVATTRAKQRLVVSGGWPTPGKEVPPETAPNFAALIGRRLDPESTSSQIEDGRERVLNRETRVQQVLPAYADPRVGTDDGEEKPSIGFPSDGQMKAIDELTVARRSAVARMKLPVIRSASADAHDRVRWADGEEGEQAPTPAGARDLAMAIGTAIHGLLETVDLDADLRSQVERNGDRLRAEIVGGLDEDQAAEAEATIDDLLTTIATGSCLQRLAAVAPHVISRELPVYGWEEVEHGPGVVVSGIVDLVYRDPDDGRVVVADYKTDAVADQTAIEERTHTYEAQVNDYGRILRAALGLEEDLHTELWFLAADTIVRL